MDDDEDGGARRDAGPHPGDTEYPMMSTSESLREGGPVGRAGAANFDPTPYLRQLRGRGGQGQDYLDVKWRLLWLRREHPDAEIVTNHVRIDDTIAIFKATVSVPNGGKASGYGSETAGDFGDFIEKAETKAIGRALNALGYGAQFTEPGDEDALPPTRGESAASPTPPRSAAPGPAPTAPRPAAPPAQPSPRPRPAPPSAPAAAPPPVAAPPIDFVATRDRVAPPTPVGPKAVAPPADADVDADLADYSWSAFWPWAKKLGFANRAAIEELIGRPIAGLSPADLRDLVQNEVKDER